MPSPKLPDELEYLRNLISGAKGEPNHYDSLLRDIVKSAADSAPTADIIRMSEFILQRGIEIEQSKHARFN